MSKIKKRLLFGTGVVVLAYCLLLMPDLNKAGGSAATNKAFTWNKDLLWSQLENNFRAAKLESKPKVD